MSAAFKTQVLQGLMTVVYISTCMWFFFTQIKEQNVRTIVRLKWYKSQDVTCDPTDSWTQTPHLPTEAGPLGHPLIPVTCTCPVGAQVRSRPWKSMLRLFSKGWRKGPEKKNGPGCRVNRPRFKVGYPGASKSFLHSGILLQKKRPVKKRYLWNSLNTTFGNRLCCPVIWITP